MNETFIRARIETADWKSLAFVAVSAVTIMILGIENAFENRVAFAIFALFTLVGVIAKGLAGVGLITQHLSSSFVAGTVVGIFYGTLRGLLLKFVPSSQLILGADLAMLAPRLEAGISIGPLLLTKDWLFLFWLFLLPGMITMELYFRGVLFGALKQHVHWTGAVAVASTVQWLVAIAIFLYL